MMAICTRTCGHAVLKLILCGSALLSLLLTGPARGAPGDELWDTRWNRPGASDTVWETVEYDGQLVIVGDFEHVGDVSAKRVAIYDGESWSPLGAGFTGTVDCAVVYDGELYVNGAELSDGTPTGGIARWNGSAWIPFGGGVNGYVTDMLVHDGEFVIIGNFTTVGSTGALGIAGWDGTNWHDFDGGVYDGYPVAGASDGVNLYLVGEMYGVGSVSVHHVARWNGNTWSGVGGGVTDETGDQFGAYLEDCHVWNGQLVVSGGFQRAGGQAMDNLAVWNGASWGPLGGDPSFFSGGAFTLGEYDGDLLVYDGQLTVWVWNGFFWGSFAYGPSAFTIGNWGSSLVLGGFFSDVNGVQAQNVATYDGIWSALATGDGPSRGLEVLHEWDGMLVAGGNRARFGPLTNTLVAAWDGAQWNPLGAGIPNQAGGIVSAAATFEGDLVIGGSFATAGGVPANKLARFDGASWSAMGSGSNASVYALTVSGGELYAGIYGISPASYQVARWNGTAWDAIGPTNDSIWALGEYAGQLVACGTFNSIGGSAVRGLATWDGASWTGIGGSLASGSVYDLAVLEGRLYVAGTFTSIGGVPASRVAVWDGATWSPLGAGVNNRAFELAVHDGELFAAGEFTHSGGTAVNHVARWDGAQWHAMGSGLNDDGAAIVTYAGQLYVGGEFTTAGGHASEGLAGWNSPATAAPVAASRFQLRAVGPNPFGERTGVQFELPAAQDVTVTILDVRGRQVDRRRMTGLSAGAHQFDWNGRDGQGRQVAAGTYLMRVQAGTAVGSRRLVVVR